MEILSLLRDFLSAVQAIGPWGIIFFVWWTGNRDNQKWKEMHEAEQRQWEDRFIAMRQMYENNITLVKSYEKFANEQQNLIIMNTQAFCELTTIIKERIK